MFNRSIQIRSILILAVLALTVSLAAQTGTAPKATIGPVADMAGGCDALQAAAAIDPSAAHGFDLTNLDRSVKPCDDFFQFAGGGFMKANPIPAAYSRWGNFDMLRAHNEDVLHDILEAAAKNQTAEPGSTEQKIGDFYASCMNTDAIEAAGLKPLEPEFERIAAIKNTVGLQAEIAHLQMEGVSSAFGFRSEQDLKDSTKVIGGANQGGLGLPDRDYYTKTDDKSVKLREGYVAHVAKMLSLAGDDAGSVDAEAKTVMALETKLAGASLTRVERRQPENTYHPMSVADLKTATPAVSWEQYFHEIGFPAIDSINVAEPVFFKTYSAMIAETPLADWKVYLRWHLVHSSAEGLPSAFVDENFNFYGKTLTGAQELLPRWKRCVRSTDHQLGEALGQVYVKKVFPPESKARALEMVHNLVAALRDDLATLDWMGPETRKQARIKLDAIALKIGYPDHWRDYSAFKVVRSSYAENVEKGNEFEFHRDASEIGKPVDRTEWGMTPPTVNAYYNPSMNEIVFPAGILQPPFFDAKRDDALNYGGMGSVIGHEMTHGFDDQGAKFDAQGNLKNWWTPEDLKNFQARSQCIIDQFDAYEVEPGLHENGKLVVGESIADLGGLTIAHAAFDKTLAGKPAPKEIDGFNAEQRFFLAWAQIWFGSARPEQQRLLVATDPHPLQRFRGNGPPSNMPSFAKAFGCSAGSPMVRSEKTRCRIW
jgi:putative endopeptidase